MALDDVQERLSEQAEKVGTTVTTAVDELRDRTADRLRADGGSVFRELHRLSSHLDATEDRLHSHVDERTAALEDRLDALVAASKRTSWPRRLVWLLAGGALGAAATYLADPDRGKARRAELSNQASSQARAVAKDASGRAKAAVQEAKGAAIEQAKDVLPDQPEADPHLLEQRIKSEVLGRHDDAGGVVLRIDGPGMVALKGTVATAATEYALLSEVAGVDGVAEVTSELTVREPTP